jgi:hypothetical protein
MATTAFAHGWPIKLLLMKLVYLTSIVMAPSKKFASWMYPLNPSNPSDLPTTTKIRRFIWELHFLVALWS